jgi:hypothetical protein
MVFEARTPIFPEETKKARIAELTQLNQMDVFSSDNRLTVYDKTRGN